MALERKRQLNEVLMRRNPNAEDGTPGTVGVSIAYLTWIAEDGVIVPDSAAMENPTDSDWQSDEVKGLLGEALLNAQGQVTTLTTQVATLTSQLAALQVELDAEKAAHAITEQQNRDLIVTGNAMDANIAELGTTLQTTQTELQTTQAELKASQEALQAAKATPPAEPTAEPSPEPT